MVVQTQEKRLGKSKATQRINRIFDKLRAEGRLEPQRVVKQAPKERLKCRTCKRYVEREWLEKGRCKDCRSDAMTQRTKEVKPRCCLVKYGDNIPNGFKKCFGCPLDSETVTQ